MQSIAGIVGGGLVVLWALFDDRFRDFEGYLTGRFCLALSIGVGLSILGLVAIGSLRRTILWLVLALIGQAVTLQLIDAGSVLRYQHYRSLTRLVSDTSPFAIIFLTLQSVLVGYALVKKQRTIAEWFKRNFRLWQLMAVTAVFVITSTALSRDAGSYLGELPIAVYLQLLNLANIVIVVWSIPNDSRKWILQKLETFYEAVHRSSNVNQYHINKVALFAALWVFVVAALLSYFSYQRHPHITDEVAYLFHARYFAEGMVSMPVTENTQAFEIPLMDSEGQRRYSVFPPGWPLVLAIGVLLNVPWLVNPLLGGLNVLLSYFLVARLYERRTATAAVLLLCVSPWHVFMNMSFMSHTLTLTCGLVASLFLLKCRTTKHARWALVAGVVVGFTSLIRPLDGALLCLFFGLCVLSFSGMKLRLSSLAALLAGAITIAAGVLPYNQTLTGKATTLPVNLYFDKNYGPHSNAFGFGMEPGAGWAIDAFPGHSPLEGFLNAILNAFSVNIELFGWACGSLILLTLYVLTSRPRGRDALLLLLVVLIFVAHFFYYFNGGPDFGARYWYLMLFPLVVLTVRAIQFFETRVHFGAATSTRAPANVMLGILALSLCVLINYFPWRAIDKYHHYWGMRSDIRHLASQYDFGKSLVLVRGENFPDYASAAIYNPIDLQANAPIYVWDKDPETRSKILKSYSDRPVWILEGPSLTRTGYRIVEGPLPPDQLASIGAPTNE